jgi:hypothetical protein
MDLFKRKFTIQFFLYIAYIFMRYYLI